MVAQLGEPALVPEDQHPRSGSHCRDFPNLAKYVSGSLVKTGESWKTSLGIILMDRDLSTAKRII
jgi:hypothetical protein